MPENTKIILVPVDFEKPSAQVISVAKKYSQLLGAETVLLHVCQPPVVAYPEVPPTVIEHLTSELLSAARKSLAELAANEGGLRSILKEGDPGVEIVRLLPSLKPEMIVMGTHGRRGFRRILLGSVAEYVVRHSSVPVMTVRASATEEEQG